MKITIVTAEFNLSGGIRVIAIYAEYLRKQNHEVLVVSPAKRKPTFRQQVRSLLKGRGWIKVPPNPPSHFDNTNVRCCLLDHQPPITDADLPDADVVIATWWETAEWVANLSPSKGAKVYFMQDYGAPGQELEKIVPTWHLPLHIITICQWLADLINKHAGEIPLTIIPNAVDLEKFYAPPRVKQPSPQVGFLYRAVPSKGIDIAIEAVRRARKNFPNLQLIAYGSKPPEASLPLPADTIYKQRPEDAEVKEIYASCDAWLFPSRIEGFGLPILEAMACRTPVIGTPAGAAPELLVDGAGILVRPDDPDDMAKAIEQICNFSEAEWLAMSDAAYAKATSYTWEKAADLFESALQVAIQRTERGDFAAI
jgi:glycosyltransferase involved in cell wall biosynthesis